tara:strand:- start:171 stop:599 length:429 start_codon:yes stop_codon:yes gene_type:complete
MTTNVFSDKTFQIKLQWSLLFLRLGVFIVMFVWNLDKFINPAHTGKVFEIFYGINMTNHSFTYVLASLQLLLIVLFVTGIKKPITYGLILLMHAGSTFSAYAIYMSPFNNNNLLFFAAWPMLAACIALYLLRDADTKFTLGK